ncbi:MAG: hypothetical protein KC616_23205 [Myxococcales bacterium]|nr:hypothetical protein [Myxococcales bacterium]
MSQQIDVAFQTTYEQIVEHLLQQKGSRLERTVRVKNGVKGTRWRATNQIGKRNATRLTSRHQRTVHTDTPHSNRYAHPKHYADADLFDEEDDLESLIDPTNEYAEAMAMAIGRSKDEEIFRALGGTAITDEDDATGVAFDTSNQVVASGSTGMNVDKAIEAMRRLMLAEVDPTMEECFLVLTAIQHDQMMRETQAISLDYMPAPVMQDGMITRFGGFNFVICSDELVPKVGSDRYVYAYCRSAIRFGNWGSGVKSRMDVMPDYNYSTQVHTKASFGAVRAEEGKVVRILCTES